MMDIPLTGPPVKCLDCIGGDITDYSKCKLSFLFSIFGAVQEL